MNILVEPEAFLNAMQATEQRFKLRRRLATEWKELRDGIRFAPRSAKYLRRLLAMHARLKRNQWASVHPLFGKGAL